MTHNNSNLEINIKLSSNILDNAFDSLHPSIEILKSFDGRLFSVSDERKLKLALLSVTTSVELLLKSKIAFIDWREIFQKPVQADLTKILTGDLYSLRFEDCLRRIESISPIYFPGETKAEIDRIRQIRNKIIHFHYSTNREDLISLISIGISIFIEFYRDYILNDFLENNDRTTGIDEDLKNVKEYVNKRVATLTKKYEDFDRPKTFYFSECNNCIQDSLIIKDKNVVKCIYCEYEEDIKWIAEIHSAFENKTQLCPKCFFHSMTAIENVDGKDAWDCIICGYFINKTRHWRLSLNGDKLSQNSIRE
jgi:hypothetical protein